MVLKPDYVYDCVKESKLLEYDKNYRLILTEDGNWDKYGVDWVS
jgi:hypothetical protein